jgi:hypothetical protein
MIAITDPGGRAASTRSHSARPAAVTASAAAIAAALAGCAGGVPAARPTPGSQAHSPSPSAFSAAPTSPAALSPTLASPVIDKVGFGQVNYGASGNYIFAIAIVSHLMRGQSVTVEFNAYSGSKLVTSGSQVDGISVNNLTFPVANQFTVPGNAKITRVTGTLSVSPAGYPMAADVRLRPGHVAITNSYGSWTLSTPVTNPSDRTVSSPNVTDVCYNAAGRINGGGYDFPSTVPAGGTIVDPVMGDAISGTPTRCVGYVEPW